MSNVIFNHERSKKATNLSIDAELLKAAREFEINISRACEAGLAKAVTEARAAQWLRDNAEALVSSNLHAEKHGIPLARHRQF